MAAQEQAIKITCQIECKKWTKNCPVYSLAATQSSCIKHMGKWYDFQPEVVLEKTNKSFEIRGVPEFG